MTKTTFREIRETEKFQKELRKLSKKRFQSLPDDFEIFKDTQLKLFHKQKIDNDGIVRISDLGIKYPFIYKVTKFACKSLKGKGVHSGIRLIYAYFTNEDIIEFIEIYHKSDKENEDRERIKAYYNKPESAIEK
jgi:mRNA-degrading endonuclease RelE of RelBE toxin-antitoxin system